eukprot:273791_1
MNHEPKQSRKLIFFFQNKHACAKIIKLKIDSISIKYFKRVLDMKATFGIAWKEYGDLLGFRLDDWKNAEYAYDQSVKYQHAFQWNALNNASYGLAFKVNKRDKLSSGFYVKNIYKRTQNLYIYFMFIDCLVSPRHHQQQQ